VRGAKPERALETLVEEQLALEAGTTVIVACSGGPDSVALALLAVAAAARVGAKVVLGHVNHGLRRSAYQDEGVVLSVAARLGCMVRVAAPPAAGDDEAALRELRYGALTSIARESGARAVVTAHTAEDQTETILLALFRGTGLEGLAGMPARRTLAAGIELVRPLLLVPRERLRGELRRSALPYALDPTNEHRRYRRNALRTILIELRDEFPHLDEAVARCGEIVREELADSPRSRTRRHLRETLRGAGELADVPFERIEAAARAVERNTRGRIFMKAGVELALDRDGGDQVVRRGD
jgi:tRNA(Ile)-lysidine synthase